ncbi:MAG: helicase-associated domain-containing protein [Anaerolineaceae bacterium]|nr:helicase-associated domain-containing protein [Anaerolineaceae bacterium]
MPNISQTNNLQMLKLSEMFQDYEIDQIEMIIEQWGIEDDINPRKDKKKQVACLLTNEKLFLEIFDSLSNHDQEALKLLASEGGRISRRQFTRLFGNVREMGALKREKERPDRKPVSIAENLFYKGIIGISFFNKEGEAKEYFYLPYEFNEFLNSNRKIFFQQIAPLTVSCKKTNRIISSSDKILDHICTYLSGLRGQIPQSELSRFLPAEIQPFLTTLLQSLGIINADRIIIDAYKIRDLLVQERAAVFSNIYRTWVKDKRINELRLVPGLTFEGKWKNDPVKPRKKVIAFIRNLEHKWYSKLDFIKWVYEHHPDFLRSVGEYDIWFIKDSTSNVYLNGFDNWHKVEGALLEYFLRGPFYWMGLLDLALDPKTPTIFAFRKTDWADKLIDGKQIDYATTEADFFALQKNGDIFLPVNSQQEIRYQIARFCKWVDIQKRYYRYKIDSEAIQKARDQHISPSQIKSLLMSHAKKPIPTNIFTAIDRWGKKDNHLSIEKHTLFKVSSKKILDQIENSPAKRYLIERINRTTAIILSKDTERFKDALIELGYFADISQEV